MAPFYTGSRYQRLLPVAEILARRVALVLKRTFAGVPPLGVIQFRRKRKGKIDMSVKAAIAAIRTKRAHLQAPEVYYFQAEVSITPSSVVKIEHRYNECNFCGRINKMTS